MKRLSQCIQCHSFKQNILSDEIKAMLDQCGLSCFAQEDCHASSPCSFFRPVNEPPGSYKGDPEHYLKKEDLTS